MTEDDLREAAEDPRCPFSYEELWQMYFGPPGPSLSEMIEEWERKVDRGHLGPDGPAS